MRLFSEKVQPTFTSSDLNILTVESLEEVFFDVYEFEINGNKFIAEKKSQYKGSPVVNIPVVKGNKEYSAPFVLREGEFEVLFNEENTTFVGSSEVTEDDLSVFEQEEIVEDIVLEKKGDILKDVRSARLAAKEYAEKIKEIKLQEADSEIKLREEKFNSLLKEARKSLVEEFLNITENTKAQIFNYNEETEDKLSDYIDNRIEKYTSDFTLNIEGNYKKSTEALQEKVESLTKDIYVTKITNLIEERLTSDGELITKSIESKVDKKQESQTKEIKEIKSDVVNLEKVNIEVNDNIIKGVNKALSRIGNVKKDIDSNISTLKESIDNKLVDAEQKVKDYYDEKISLVEESFQSEVLYRSEENKKAFYKLIEESKSNLLDKISKIKNDTPGIIVEKYGDKNVKIDPKKIQKDIENNLNGSFQQQILSLKKSVEMMGGGGSVAKQFAAGGTMNGDLNVVGNILSGGTNLLNILSGGGGVDGSGTSNYIPLWSDSDTLGNSIAFQEDSSGDLTTQLSIAGDLSALGTLSASDARFGSDSVRIDGPNGTIDTSGDINSETAIIANTALCSWGGTSCFGGVAVNICEATPLNACGCVQIGQGVSGGVPLTVHGTLCATTIDATSAYIKVVDITQYELTGFDVNGDFTISGNLSANDGLSATGDNIYFSDRVGIGTCQPEAPLHVDNAGATLSQWHRNGTQLVTIGGSSNKGQIRFQYGSDCISTGATTGGDYSIDTGGSVGAGDNMLYVCKAGDVGIGTTTPEAKLSIVGDVSATGGLSAAAVTGTSYFGGDVGIGTSSPSHKLNVAVSEGDDGIVLQKAGTANDLFRVSMDGTTDQGEMFLYDNSGVPAGTAVFAVRANTNYSYINTQGNFGIGTSAPGSKLSIVGDVSATGGLSAAAVGGCSYFGGNVGIGTTTPEANLDIRGGNEQHLYIEGANDSVTALARIKTIAGGSVLQLETQTASDSRDILKAKNSSGTVLNLQADGKLGIGVETPSETLAVAGTISACGGLSATNNITIERPGTTGRSELIIKGKGNSSGDHVGMVAFKSYTEGDPLASIKAIRHNADELGCMAFATSDTERVRIDNDGNVGIGTDAPNAQLHVSNSGSPTFRLSRTGTGQIWQQGIDSSGRFLLQEAASEGGTQYTRLGIDDAGDTCLVPVAGNVGIGTTLPGAKLSIVGDVSATGGLSAAILGDTSYFGGKIGIGTTSPEGTLQLADSCSLRLGNGGDFRLYHNGSNNFVEGHGGDMIFYNYAHGNNIIFCGENDSGTAVEYLKIDPDAGAVCGPLLRGGNCVVTSLLDAQYISNVGEVCIHSGKSGCVRIGSSQGYGMTLSANNDNVARVGIGGTKPGSEALTVAGNISANGNLYLGDDGQINLGVNDLQLYHDGSNSYVTNATGDMYFINSANDKDIVFQSDDGSGGFETYFFLDGSASSGNPRTIFPDNSTLDFGTGQDMRIIHDGFNSYILNFTNDLYLRNDGADKDIVFQIKQSTTETEVMRVDGSAASVGIGTTAPSEKLTVSGNISANGTLSATGTGVSYFGGKVGISDDSNHFNFISDDIGAGLHIRSKDDVAIILEADTDNSGESDNPKICFKQDNGACHGSIYMQGNHSSTNRKDSNSFVLGSAGDSPVSIVQNGYAQITIASNGNVGIGCYKSASLAERFTVGGGISARDGIFLGNLPTSDPGEIGQVWNDSGDLKISAG